MYNDEVMYNFAQADFTKAYSPIEATNWESLLTGDVNQALTNWEAKYMEIMELCIPKKSLPKQRNLPWLTKELTKGIRKRNLLYGRARRGGNSLLFDRYKEQRNKVVNELCRSKSHFFRSFNPSNPKQFWKIAKLLNKNSSSIPSLVKNGYTATTDSDKATMLNGFFSECFNTAQPPLSINQGEPLSYLEPSNFESIDNLLCTEDKVYEMIASLDTSKANGSNGISARMLKGTAHSITPVLTHLFNMSIESGIFPDKWKLSSVVPIPKGGDHSNPSNYRLISLLSVISKMLERHVYYLITEHLSSVHPLANTQWGFQSGKSTVSALLTTTHD